MTRTTTYSIGALAEAAGVSRRTVRFYVQRGLLAPPEGLGRGAHYTDDHLASLLQIKGWQEQGVPLEQIRWRSSGRAEAPALAPPREPSAPSQPGAIAGHPIPSIAGTAWVRQPLAAGVELHVSAARRPLTARQLAALSRALGEILQDEGEEE